MPIILENIAVNKWEKWTQVFKCFMSNIKQIIYYVVIYENEQMKIEI